MLTEDKIVPSTEEPIPVVDASFDDQGLAPEDFPVAAPDPFVKAEEGVTQEYMDESSGIELPSEEPEPIDLSSPESTSEVYLPPPEEDPLPSKTQVQSKRDSFYAAEELEIAVHDSSFDESQEQQFMDGRSDLEDAALEQAAASDSESDQMAIESIISDPTISQGIRASVLENYIQRGSIPVPLKERYINKLASNLDNSDYEDREVQREISETLGPRKTDLDIRSRNEDIDVMLDSHPNISAWESYKAGVNQAETGINKFIGNATEANVKEQLVIEQKILASGDMVNIITNQFGQLTPAIAAGAMAVASLPVTLGTTATVGLAMLVRAGVVWATASTALSMDHYSRLDAQGVNKEILAYAAVARGTMTGLEIALPIFRSTSILQIMALNGGGNLLIGQLSVAVQNEVLKAYPELQREQFNTANMTVDGLLGAGLGLLFGRIKMRSAPVGQAPIDGVSSTEVKGLPAPNTPRPKKHIPVNSPAEAQKVANPKKATDEAVRIIKENDVKSADTITDGAGIGAYAADIVLPNFNVDPNLNLNAANQLIEDVKKNDYVFTEGMKDSRFNDVLQNTTQRNKLHIQALAIRADVQGGPVYSQSNSNVPLEGIDFTEGRDVYLPRKGGTYKMTESGESSPSAQRELAKIQARVDASSLRGLGDVHFIKKDQGWVIEHTWKKEWVDTYGILGIDEVHLAGIPATNLARSAAGKWFIPNPANQRMGDPHIIGIEKEALYANRLDRIAEKSIHKLKHKLEFHNLINHGMQNGIDHYSIKDIFKLYSKTLTWKQAEEVYVAHKRWRRSLDYTHVMAARQHRNKLANEGWRGLRATGNMNSLMLATTKIPTDDLARLKSGEMNVLNYEANIAEGYRPKEGDGRTLVRLKETLEVGGSSYEYVTFGSDMNLGILPDVTLKKLKGFSPRFHMANFYIDAIPKSKMVNGRTLSKFDDLAKYKTTVAGAKTINEANEIAAKMGKDNSDFTFVPRRERANKLEQFAEQMQVASKSAEVERGRGQQQLTDGNGNNIPIGDHWQSMKRTNQTLSHVEAFDQVDRILQHDFVETHKVYLAKGTFPEDSADVRMPENSEIPLKQLERGYKEALRNLEYYQKQKVLKTLGDFNWEGMFHSMADTFESFAKELEKSEIALIKQGSRNIPDALRMFGDQGNLLTKVPKWMASAFMISMSPARQLIIQGQQAREMLIVNPIGAFNAMRLMYGVRTIYLFSPEPDLPNMTWVKFMAKEGAMGEAEMLREYHNVRKSGLFDGLNRHELIRDAMLMAEKGLNESGIQTTSRWITNATNTVPHWGRELGFKIGELDNKMGMYFQARDILRRRHPEKDWNTPENLAIIAIEGNKLAGAMNRAASLPYQHGILSSIMQFWAIPHKMLFNVIQNTATIMDPKMRIKLFAARSAMYGEDATLILPALGYVYEMLMGDDDPWLQDYPNIRYMLKNGIGDVVMNYAINLAFYKEGELDKNGNPQVPSNIAFGDALIPYSDLLYVYADLAYEVYKLYDKDISTMPRTAGTEVISRINRTARDLGRIWGKLNKNAPTHEKLLTSMSTIGKLSSGWNNLSKAILMESTRRVETANGFEILDDATVPEAIAKAWGFRSHKEIDAYKNYLDDKKLEFIKQDIADNVYKDMIYIADNFGTDKAESIIDSLGMIWGIIREGSEDLDDKDIEDILDKIMNKLDREGKDGRTVITMKLIEYNGKNIQGPMKGILQRMLDSKNPKQVEWAKGFKEGKI